MEKQQSNSLQNFDESKTEILKKRLLKSANTATSGSATQNNSQHNVLLNTLRAPTSSSMIVSSVQAPQSSMPLTHNLVTHSIAPVKIHTSSAPYPLQLSTVHVPVQIPGSTSNINVPVQLSGPTSSVPLQLAPGSLPIQVSGTTSVPVQLPAGETINVPLQIPSANQNIQITGPGLNSMPILQNSNQPLSSIIHVHMGSNTRPGNMDTNSDMNNSGSSQLHLTDSSGVHLKMNTATSVSQVQMGSSPAVVQIPNSSNNSIQLTLPNTGNAGTVQLRGTTRPMPHVVYIQTPTGLKPVTSTEVISQASTSGNPPQIIVRRPVTSNSNIQLISNLGNKPNIAPKVPVQKSSIIASNGGQPIVIQKPKPNEKVMVPVTIAPGPQGKQTIAYLGSMKKAAAKPISENQSILISNNQNNANQSNQKLFLTPMMPKIQNTKFILPVTLPATMASKGPIINLQIANGQIQNDPQGNSITVMRDTQMETSEMPPLQPLAKVVSVNGKDNNNSIPQSPKSEKSFTMSIPGSRAEPTGEQGEYTLSIPETNASMNDDIYTVSIADEDGNHREKSFTLAIPEKSKSLLNKNVIDKNDNGQILVPAPAILRRSNSDNSERKTANTNLKRRISLCTDKNYRLSLPQPSSEEKLEEQPDPENNDDHRVPSLFCDEKLEEPKANVDDSDTEEVKDTKSDEAEKANHTKYYKKVDIFYKKDRYKRESLDSAIEEDPPGLIWNNGVATLHGSNLQFKTNEFGLIDVINLNQQEERMKFSDSKQFGREKPTSPEEMYRCVACGCHGMAAEFITPTYCSLECQTVWEKLALKRKEREKIELIKKRNKVRKLLMRKQASESEVTIEPKDEKPLKHYDSAPSEAQLSDSVKNTDDFVENEKYPWMCGKNGFSWMRYLDVCKAKAAPVKLFKDPFPYNRNNFKVGMRMEAIDPQHPSLFCVVSVAEVQGYRMRLHFDEYPEVYDYWVNADCPDMFPAGWCERNGRSLRPPASYTPQTFSWPLYLKQMRAVAAPKQLFPHLSSQVVKPNGFRIGMKLEADDRKNKLVCVATIADMLDNRLLINFDSWDEMYDYWVEPTSPHIHPVGWAEENGISLTPPNFYKDPDSFSWESYLEETGASAAPPRAFKTRAPAGFKPGMKLEVVDPRVPFLIRVATISAVREHTVRVSFDGWGDQLCCWLEDDSPDLHPVGWCLKTMHPLEPPLTEEEAAIAGPCGVGGCRGLGSVRGGSHKQHVCASACPYRAPPAPPPDRLQPHSPPDLALPRPRRSVTHGSHKQHSACPYRAPPAPPPDRLQPHSPPDLALPRPRRSVTHGSHKQHSACPYRAPPAPPPDRLQPHSPPDLALPRPRRSVTHGSHKQHSACPYRAPPAPPPDRLQPHSPPDLALPRPRRSVTHGSHKQHSACPYRAPPAPPPDRLQPHSPPDLALPRPRRSVTHGSHKQHSACPYRAPPAPPPDRLQPHSPPDLALPRPRRSVTHGSHKQHSACPYRAPPAPPPDRLQPHSPPDLALPRPRRSVTHGSHKQHSACPYRAPPAPPPDRLQPHSPPDLALPRPRRSVTHGSHKQHSACPYRAPPAPPPDRLQPHSPPDLALPRPRRSVTHGSHKQHSACPYRAPPAPPPDRLQPHSPPDLALPRPRRSVTHGSHKQHSACPYRAPPAPPPDRLQPHSPPDLALPRPRRSVTHGSHKQHSACPYRAPPAPPPDRLQPHSPPDLALPRPRRSVTHGSHKQHSACPYRAPPAPPPDRLQPHSPPDLALPRPRRSVTHGSHKQHSACPYRAPPAPPPDRLQPHSPPDLALPRPRRSVTHGSHKQHSACPYRAPPAPPPDRLQPHSPPDLALPRPRRSVTHGSHKQHSACPYRAPPAPPPDRLQPHSPPDLALPRPRRSVTHGSHKQHSACPYRAPPAPPPDRLQPHSPPDLALPRPRRLPAKPKPLTSSTPTSETSKGKYVNPRGRPPKHKRVEEVVKHEISDDESLSSGAGGKRWRGSEREASKEPERERDRDSARERDRDSARERDRDSARERDRDSARERDRDSARERDRDGARERDRARRPLRTYSRKATPPAAPRRPPVAAAAAELCLPTDPRSWTEDEVAAVATRVAGAAAGAAALAARLAGPELLLASRDELVQVARMRLGPAIKLYAAVTQLRETLASY